MSKIDISKYPDTVEAFGGIEQRAKVFLDRYALKDENGDPVERLPEQMFQRVADAIGDTYEERTEFLNLLRGFKFVPGGRILAGAGTGREVTFYNCYVIPVETEARRGRRRMKHDSIMMKFEGDIDPEEARADIRALIPSDEGNDSRRAIFDTIGRMVDIMSRGGGVGINWSVLRPQGAYLKTVNGTSSGPVGWMDVASKAVGEVEQGGSRRGAAMFMLDDWHPDVERFIEEKRDLTKIKNANVSVAVSDDFMRAVEEDLGWQLRFPDTSHPAYDAEWDGDINAWEAKYPDAVVYYKTVKARDLWRKMAEMAWDNGEPGVVFLDRYNKLSTGRGIERIISVNPCGEQGLGAYSVCNLGAMNLDAYVVQQPSDARDFDWSTFRKDVKTAVRFLDNVIDKNYYFIPENEKQQKNLRRIGLGVMGLADALIGLRLRYGSQEAVNFVGAVFREMKLAAIEASIELAEEKGSAPAWDQSMLDRPYFADFGELVTEELWFRASRHGLRNLFLLTQAPTGTTSLLAGVNSGIEPIFAMRAVRDDRTGKWLMVAPAWTKYGPEEGVEPGPEFVTANEVTVEEHIAMQAAAQRYIDSSVSKTINAPNSHTVEDVEKAYTLAYKRGLKGIAYFRDGCGRQQVLTREDSDKAKDESLKAEVERVLSTKPRRRPSVLTGRTWKQPSAVGSVYVTVNRDEDGNPFEVFINAGKSGSDVMVMGEALGRVISVALQNGTVIREVAHTLVGVGGRSKLMPSLPHGVAVSLLEDEALAFAERDEAVEELSSPATMSQEITGQFCPECKTFTVVPEEGCSKCHACGYSAC